MRTPRSFPCPARTGVRARSSVRLRIPGSELLERQLGGVFERTQHPGDVTHGRGRRPTVGEWACRLSLEIDDHPLSAQPEHLCEVEVAVDADGLAEVLDLRQPPIGGLDRGKMISGGRCATQLLDHLRREGVAVSRRRARNRAPGPRAPAPRFCPTSPPRGRSRWWSPEVGTRRRSNWVNDAVASSNPYRQLRESNTLMTARSAFPSSTPQRVGRSRHTLDDRAPRSPRHRWGLLAPGRT